MGSYTKVAHSRVNRTNALKRLAFGERARDEGGRDHREHHLEDHERQVRHGRGVVGIWILTDSVEADPLESADDARPVSGPNARL